MLRLLAVVLLAVGVVAKDAAKTSKTDSIEAVPAETVAKVAKDTESAEIRVPDYFDRDLRQEDNLYLKAKLDDHHPDGPIVARNLPSNGHPNIAAQDEIIKFTYSPAYYEPIWVLDYRFLKSGGRRYTRGPGGQILILPKSYRHHKGDGTHDYDSMIEHLRLKMIAEQNERAREHGFEPHRREQERGYERGYEQEQEQERGYGHEGYEREDVNLYH